MKIKENYMMKKEILYMKVIMKIANMMVKEKNILIMEN